MNISTASLVNLFVFLHRWSSLIHDIMPRSFSKSLLMDLIKAQLKAVQRDDRY